MITLTYGFGVALAAFAGVMAAPIYQVSPLMGADLIIVVFAVVVIGGMGSIMGAILTGFGLGLIEGLTKVFYPEASNIVIFVIMVDRAADQAGRAVRECRSEHPRRQQPATSCARSASPSRSWSRCCCWRRLVVYPVFLMKVMCFALFACAFNLLHRLRRPALVRARHVPRLGRLCVGARGQGLGLPPELAILLAPRWRSCSASFVGCWRSAAGHLLRDDHAGAGADDLLPRLQAPFTGGEDGSRRCRAASCWASSTSPEPLSMYLFVLAFSWPASC